MTQGQLGELLNVSSQAVSKWEHDLSEPDLGTIKRIASIFKISVDDFLDIGGDDSQPEPVQANDQEVVAAVTTAVQETIKKTTPVAPIGYCSKCGIAVTEKNKGVLSPRVLCAKCHNEELETQRLEKERQAQLHDEQVKSLKRREEKALRGVRLLQRSSCFSPL